MICDWPSARQRYPGHFDVAARLFIETLAFDFNHQVRCLIRLLP